MTLFELAAVLTLNKSGFDKGISEAEGQAQGLGSKLASGLGGTVKTIAGATAAAAGAVASLTKSAVQNYSEYEQLVGGVDTLFKDASQKLQDYAENAYKTAGMSTNAYMENVTAFSASLISSLGGDTEAAAEYANRAMISMSDNANKMGTNIDSIVQTYQSLARGNFAMLDNLKLGYGGTKAELEKLIKDASTYTDVQKEMGITVDATSTSFDNIVNAIAVVQGQLGIAGATAQEAESTIQGAAGSMKAAWDNLVTGLGNSEADITGLTKSLVASFATTFKNIIPIVKQALSGIGTALKEGAPIISEAIVFLLGDGSLLNSLVEAGMGLLDSLISTISTNLPSVLSTAFDIAETLTESTGEMLPKLAEVGLQIVMGLGQGISENIGSLTETVVQAVTELALMLTNPDTLTDIIEAGLSVIMALGQGILEALPTLIEQLPLIIDNVVQTLTQALPLVLDAGIQLLMGLVQAIPQILPTLTAAIPQIINSITSFLISAIPTIVNAGVDLLVSLVNNLPTIIDGICKALPDLIAGLVNGIIGHIPDIINAGIDLITHLFDNLPAILSGLASAIGSIVSGIFETFTNPENIGKILDIGKRLIEGVWEGISKMGSWIMDKVGGFFGGIVDGIKDFLGIHSPSTVFAGIGGNMAAGIGVGFDDEFGTVRKNINNQMDFTATSAVTVDRNVNDTYNSAYSSGEGGNSGGGSSESKQPIVIVVQLESGIELARALIEDINNAKRIDGIAY